MSVLDKLVAAVTPEPDEDKRIQVRSEARSSVPAGTWLTMVIDHHEEIEQAFAAVRSATDLTTRRAAQKQLVVVLTGHSLAEEVVLYPAMALSDQKGHSTAAYTEQSAAKVQAAALDDLDPMSDDYFDKLEHLRAAVSHHMYEEESTWFPELRDTVEARKQAFLTQRYQEEFMRYVHGITGSPIPALDGPMTESIGSADGSGALVADPATPVGTPGAMTDATGGRAATSGALVSERDAVDAETETGTSSSVF